MSDDQMPQSRYVLPSFIERTSYGIKESNPYNKLFDKRIIFLGEQINNTSANDIMARLLVLESIDPDLLITMYINSPGGSVTAMEAIYDTMQFVRPEIQTVCLGLAGGAAAVLLAAGTPGKRMAVPNAQIVIQQPAPEGVYGQTSDLEIQAAEIRRMRRLQESTLAHHTGQTEERIRSDIERHEKLFTAEGAKEYGIIDEIIQLRRLSSIRVSGDEDLRDPPRDHASPQSDAENLTKDLDRSIENMEEHELEQSLEENRRKLRAMLPKAPGGLDRKTRDHVSGMVALRFSSESNDPEAVGKARPMLDAISDGLHDGRVPDVFTENWPEQCRRAVEKVDNARFYCLEGEALRCFCTILAGDILLGGDGAGSRLDPRRFLGDFYPLDWV